MSSSQRFNHILGLIHPCDEVWDIGCDHGLIGIEAFRREKARRIYFVDPAKDVIRNLQNTVATYIPRGSFSIHQKKGHEIELPEQNQQRSFVLVGFGGKQIIQALEHIQQAQQRVAQFILSPHRDHLKLREFLHHGNWHLAGEAIIEENQQSYLVLDVRNQAGSAPSLYGGAALWTSPEGERYRRHLLKILPSHHNLQDQAYLKFLQQMGQT
jgi:tRNA A22 N-methylase